MDGQTEEGRNRVRITGLKVENWLCHHHWVGALAPMTIICGGNESGKTSLADAISFGLRGVPRRVDAKGDFPLLVTDGAQKGSVSIEMGEVRLTRDVATGKLGKTQGVHPFREGAVASAVRYLLDPATIASAPSDDRRALLLAAMRVDLSPAAMLRTLAERKHPADLLADLKPDQALDVWRKTADRGATEARGAWKGITGEAYGTTKAIDWKAEAPAEPTAAEIADAHAKVTAAEARIGDLQRDLGMLEATSKAEAGRAAQRAKLVELRRAADLLDGCVEVLPAQEEAVSVAIIARAAAESGLAAVDEVLRHDHELACPHCGGTAILRDGALVAPDPDARPRSTEADRSAALTAVQVAQQEEKAAKDRLAATQKTRREAEAAKQALAAVDPAADVPADSFGDRATLETRLKNAQAARSQAAEEAKALDAAAQTAERADAATKRAAVQHARVLAWLAIHAAIGPDGIPAELLNAALAPFNETLRDMAAASGWRQVAVGPDMGITVAGRPYSLLSESSRWRADAHLGAALAIHSRCAMLMLDRFDVLEVSSRRPALTWLYSLTTDQRLDTVVVLGTLREPPKVPNTVEVHWLGEPLAVKAAA